MSDYKFVLYEPVDDGRIAEYDGVPQENFRRLSSSGSMWSYFRDNIDEEYATRRMR